MMAVHVLFLAGLVAFAHQPSIFIGLLLFVLGLPLPTRSTRTGSRCAKVCWWRSSCRVVIGGQETWWLQPLLLSLDSDAVFYGAVLLTAVTDNAALTYLGSLVPGLSQEFKLALWPAPSPAVT